MNKPNWCNDKNFDLCRTKPYSNDSIPETCGHCPNSKKDQVNHPTHYNKLPKWCSTTDCKKHYKNLKQPEWCSNHFEFTDCCFVRQFSNVPVAVCSSCKFFLLTTAKEEKVTHPDHYGGDTTYEVIRVIEAWKLNFNLGTAVKYIPRAGKKDPDTYIEDLEKSIWYIKREIQNEIQRKSNEKKTD